jgi:tocopherol cyclase
LPTRLQGKVANGHDGSLGGVYEGQGVAPSTPCTFDLSITPRSGCGDDDDPNQKSTSGWLASYAVFEPHWQVTIADARASGTVLWNGTTYHFDNAPFYAEKNWGSVFPSKWYWVQCNSFANYPRLSVTAGGGIRKLPLNMEEEVGMVCIHYNGTFYQAVPWNGQMEWDVDPWGRWVLTGRCTSGDRLFESQISATCDAPGTVLRAPTQQGMKLACKDSFLATATLSLWPLEWNEDTKIHQRAKIPIIDQATTSQAAVEIGGGPWWDTWEGKSRMQQPFKTLLQIPFLPSKIKQKTLKHFKK